jgi:hypothetical protein
LLALRATLRQRTVPELCTPWPAVRHAFTSSFCLLGTPRRDYSSKLDEPHAVYGILQLKRSSNTPTSTPNPNFSSKLPPSSDIAPCRALPAELDQPRGCWSSDTPSTTTTRPLVRRRFPNLTCLGHLLSRADAQWLLEQAPPGDRAVAASFESTRLGSPHLRMTSL